MTVKNSKDIAEAELCEYQLEAEQIDQLKKLPIFEGCEAIFCDASSVKIIVEK